MGRLKKNTLHVLLADGKNDQERIETITGISKLAPQSVVYVQIPTIHAAVDAVIGIGVDLKNQGDQVTGLEKQLEEVKTLLEKTRIKYGRAIGILRTTCEGQDLSAADIASIGLTSRVGAPSVPALTPPTGVKVSLGKTHGQFRASAVSTEHSKFGAQVSPDPVGPATWVDLPGTGKRRLITGHASGSLVWVRFRTVHKETVSDWCAPVPVTVP